jgi:hypothetical protein
MNDRMNPQQGTSRLSSNGITPVRTDRQGPTAFITGPQFSSLWPKEWVSDYRRLSGGKSMGNSPTFWQILDLGRPKEKPVGTKKGRTRDDAAKGIAPKQKCDGNKERTIDLFQSHVRHQPAEHPVGNQQQRGCEKRD